MTIESTMAKTRVCSSKGTKLAAIAALLSCAMLTVARSEESAGQRKIAEFGPSFKFGYLIGAWAGKPEVRDSKLVLHAVPSAGGGGVKSLMDLSTLSDSTPTLSVKTLPGNSAKSFKLKLTDTAGRSGTWQFTLPSPSSEFAEVMADGSASVAEPNIFTPPPGGKSDDKLDVAHIAQYQFMGDWQKTSLDVEVASVSLITPSAAMLADRVAYAKKKADEVAAKDKKVADDRAAAIRSYGARTERSPEVVHVSLVAPDVLSLTIEAQHVVPATLTPYVQQPGDDVKPINWPDGTVRYAELRRDKKFIGKLQGRKLDWLTTSESIEGDPLLEFTADDPAHYTVRSSDDPAFAQGLQPTAVFRKSVPIDVRLPGGAYPTRHRIYLKFSSPIQPGSKYSIAIDAVNVKNPKLDFDASALQQIRSEAIHVNQIGYRPDDLTKRAFLSAWLGTGGAYTFPEGLSFSLLDDATGTNVFSGKVEKILDVDGKESLWVKPPKNYSGTAVYRMDFSSFDKPGTYRVFVPGIGCGYPFEIKDSVWEKAFLTQMKGIFKQRSGVELGPPYTPFKKPRDFHPDDGAIVTRSTYDVLTSGPHKYDAIAKGDTGEVVKNAWGGYHDAGDWNPRRVTHMQVTLAQLELCELFPDYFKSLNLNIPPEPGVPDSVTEALFEIDCFRRLQWADGAIPYGIETQGDPLSGEISWLSTQHCYVLAPNIRDSWLYAAVAARAARILKPIKPELAQVYQDSAVKAFAWAEADYAKNKGNGSGELWDALDCRNLSSVILYDLTGEKAYHDIFLKTTALNMPNANIYVFGQHVQSDAVFFYARLDDSKVDVAVKAKARAAVIALADRSLQYGEGNAFNLTNRERGRPMFAGFFSTSGGSELVRAHYLTGKAEYLKGAIQSCQFQAGCNPNNLVYTTGLGANPVKVPLELDARSSGQPVPEGLTVFGNADYFNFPGSFWDVNLAMVNRPDVIWPDAYQWPLTEAYFDVWVVVPANEYVTETWAPNVLVWGYLAARK